MAHVLTKKKVKLVGVVGPQTLSQTEVVSLFSDNEKEYPIVMDKKGTRLINLIGQRVEVEGELIYRWKEKSLELKVNDFQVQDLEEIEPMIRTKEVAIA